VTITTNGTQHNDTQHSDNATLHFLCNLRMGSIG
jgi:hypothetical protein